MNRTINDVSGMVIKAALRVHRELGPGLLESVYQVCLQRELESMGLSVQTEVPVPIVYLGSPVTNEAFRIDILVDDCVVVELKSVDGVKPVHKKQLLTYLRLARKPLGLLINFNEVLLRDGITRVANGVVQ